MTLAYSFISVRQHIGEVFGAMITAFPSPFTAKPTREQRSRIQASKEKKKSSCHRRDFSWSTSNIHTTISMARNTHQSCDHSTVTKACSSKLTQVNLEGLHYWKFRVPSCLLQRETCNLSDQLTVARRNSSSSDTTTILPTFFLPPLIVKCQHPTSITRWSSLAGTVHYPSAGITDNEIHF